METSVLLALIGGMVLMSLIAALMGMLVKLFTVYKKTNKLITDVEERMNNIADFLLKERTETKPNVVDSEHNE